MREVPGGGDRDRAVSDPAVVATQLGSWQENQSRRNTGGPFRSYPAASAGSSDFHGQTGEDAGIATAALLAARISDSS